MIKVKMKNDQLVTEIKNASPADMCDFCCETISSMYKRLLCESLIAACMFKQHFMERLEDGQIFPDIGMPSPIRKTVKVVKADSLPDDLSKEIRDVIEDIRRVANARTEGESNEGSDPPKESKPGTKESV